MARFGDLPEEVLEEIMLWLPPESLRRFKLVQKPWYRQINALMNDPVFVAKHLRNMKKQMLSAPNYHFRCLIGAQAEDESECPVDDEEQGELEEQELEEEMEMEDKEDEDDDEGDDDKDGRRVTGKQLLVLANDYHTGRDFIPCGTGDLNKLSYYLDNYYFKVASHCDGIICLADLEDGTVFLLNPALRELKFIRCTSYGNDYEFRGVGFGYDSRSDDYRVVVLAATPVDKLSDPDCKAEVYSLRSNSWREVKCDFEKSEIYKFDGEHEGVYCDGACYWHHWDFRTMSSFDFGDEVFRDVPLPVPKVWGERTKISVWKESPVFFVYGEDDSSAIDMWVLTSKPSSVGGSYSWTKHVTIGPLEGIKCPLGFWDDVELFLKGKEDGEINFYHLEYKMVSYISKRLDWFQDDRFVIYQKSLVSVLRKEGRRPVV